MIHSQWTGTFSSTNCPVTPLSPGVGLQSSLTGSHILLPSHTQLQGLLATCVWSHSHGCPAERPQMPLSLTSSFSSSFSIQSLTCSVSFPANGRAWPRELHVTLSCLCQILLTGADLAMQGYFQYKFLQQLPGLENPWVGEERFS